MDLCSKATTTSTCPVSASQITTREDYEQKLIGLVVCLRACCSLNISNISSGVLFLKCNYNAQHAEVQNGIRLPGCLASALNAQKRNIRPNVQFLALKLRRWKVVNKMFADLVDVCAPALYKYIKYTLGFLLISKYTLLRTLRFKSEGSTQMSGFCISMLKT